MSKGKFALGAIFGGLAGLVAGLLTAPKSGKETRADIKLKAQDAKEEAERRAVEVKKQALDTVDEAKVQADRLVKEARTSIEEYKSRGHTDSKKRTNS